MSGLPELTDAAVLAEARRRAGLDDFGADDFREPLERLMASLRSEARLNEMGHAGQFERSVGLLVNRLRTEAAIRAHPEILDEAITAPFAIVGLARTGTTMLHRMLASDPRITSLRWYESRNPAPFPGSERAARDPRIADAEAEVAMMLQGSEELIAAHPMDALAPDEDIMLVEHSFRSTNPEAFCRVPSFGRWLEAADPLPGYRTLKRLLQFLQWQKRARGEVGERWTLKTPFHLGNLAALFEVFPDVRVVCTHRDPVQTLPSFASLIHAIRVLGTDAADPVEIGEEWAGKMERATTRALRFRPGCEERFLDLHYRDLVADPLAGPVQRIYAFLGMPLTDAALAAMRRWAVENARDKRPVHRYTLERYGFSEAGLRARFAEYRARFIDRDEAAVPG